MIFLFLFIDYWLVLLIITGSAITKDITTYTGDTIVIDCDITTNIPSWRGPPSSTKYVIQGSPEINPNLPLEKRVRLFVAGNGSLVITDVKIGDEGVYACFYPGQGSMEAMLLVRSK